MEKVTKIITKRPNKYMLEFGKSLDDIRKIFGVSKATIISWNKIPAKKAWMKSILENL